MRKMAMTMILLFYNNTKSYGWVQLLYLAYNREETSYRHGKKLGEKGRNWLQYEQYEYGELVIVF